MQACVWVPARLIVWLAVIGPVMRVRAPESVTFTSAMIAWNPATPGVMVVPAPLIVTDPLAMREAAICVFAPLILTLQGTT